MKGRKIMKITKSEQRRIAKEWLTKVYGDTESILLIDVTGAYTQFTNEYLVRVIATSKKRCANIIWSHDVWISLKTKTVSHSKTYLMVEQ